MELSRLKLLLVANGYNIANADILNYSQEGDSVSFKIVQASDRTSEDIAVKTYSIKDLELDAKIHFDEASRPEWADNADAQKVIEAYNLYIN